MSIFNHLYKNTHKNSTIAPIGGTRATVQKKYRANGQRGFIALISMLIVCVVLFMIVLAVSNKSIVSRFMLLDIERKIISEELASACIEIARISVVNDPEYSVSNTPISIPVGEESCAIVTLTPHTPTSERSYLEVQAIKSGATTNFKAIIHNITGDMVSREEVAKF